MAVPGAVARRKEQEEADLRAQGLDPHGAPIDLQQPTGATPATPAAPAAPAAIPDDPAALRARIAELEGAQSTQSGRASAAAREVEELKQRLEVINGNRTFLESKLGELTQELETLRNQNEELARKQTSSTIASALDDTGPTPEQIKEYGADGIDFVERVVKRTMAGVLRPLVEQMSSMEKALGRVKEIDAKVPMLESAASVAHLSAARAKELEFLRTEVIPYFPDFETVRNTTEWKEYLQKDVPGRGYKVGQLLQTHRQAYNAAGIRTVIGGFYDERKLKPSLDSLSVPAKTGGDAPAAPAPEKLKASEYKQKLKDFTSKRLPKVEWEAYRTRWDQAIAAGNVEMDVDIR